MLSNLRWLTILSLDAPLVAVTWQALLARNLSSRQSWFHYTIVFLSVWLGYAADRWFDNHKTDRPRSEQHRFLARHSRAAVSIWTIALAAALTIAFTKLSLHELSRGVVLMSASLLYTAFAQKGRGIPGYPLFKSLLTALLILASSALFLPTKTFISADVLLPIAAIWLLFTSNCLFIRSWNRLQETHSGKRAHLLGLCSLGAAILSTWTPYQPLASACLLSLSGLYFLHLQRGRIDIEIRRTLADLFLLSPLLLLFI